MNIQFEVSELNRRLSNLIRIGIIQETKYDGDVPVCRVQIGDILTKLLPMTTARASNDKSWWPLEVGEQVLVLSQSGDPAQGIVIGSLNRKEYSSPGDKEMIHRVVYQDGAVIEYDRANHKLKAELPAGATTELISKGGVTIVGDVSIDGNLSVDKNISASGDVSDKKNSMAGDRDIYNSHVHVVPNGTSKEPSKLQ